MAHYVDSNECRSESFFFPNLSPINNLVATISVLVELLAAYLPEATAKKALEVVRGKTKKATVKNENPKFELIIQPFIKIVIEYWLVLAVVRGVHCILLIVN
jgi:hypothetical protein